MFVESLVRGNEIAATSPTRKAGRLWAYHQMPYMHGDPCQQIEQQMLQDGTEAMTWALGEHASAAIAKACLDQTSMGTQIQDRQSTTLTHVEETHNETLSTRGLVMVYHLRCNVQIGNHLEFIFCTQLPSPCTH